MILQPCTPQLSETHLEAEIAKALQKLQIVESACMDTDAKLLEARNSFVAPDQWLALMELHQTLLHEHHDFFMATNHPSATARQRKLAVIAQAPERLWKHGIHTFLEILRLRRPSSQEYMLAFSTLAYQVIGLLYEAVPYFKDTWMECLGDLGRYRMHIEEAGEISGDWRLVAGEWYTFASDRKPCIGRLYHHLGIVEPQRLPKLALYSKSLTCCVPFPQARNAMMHFSKAIVQSKISDADSASAEDLLLTCFARILIEHESNGSRSLCSMAMRLMRDSSLIPAQHHGSYLLFVAIAALFEFGAPNNILWQNFRRLIIQLGYQHTSNKCEFVPESVPCHAEGKSTSAGACTLELYTTCCNATVACIRSVGDLDTEKLTSIHLMLVWFSSLCLLKTTSTDKNLHKALHSLMDPSYIHWDWLCSCLNILTEVWKIDSKGWELARYGKNHFASEKLCSVPLSEDYWIRGLVWGHCYLPHDFLPEESDASCSIEASRACKERVRRVQILALSLALKTEYLRYDFGQQLFWAPLLTPHESTAF